MKPALIRLQCPPKAEFVPILNCNDHISLDSSMLFDPIPPRNSGNYVPARAPNHNSCTGKRVSRCFSTNI